MNVISVASLATLTMLSILFIWNKIKQGIRLQPSLRERQELVTLLSKCKDWRVVTKRERLIVGWYNMYFDHRLDTVKASPEGRRLLRSYRVAIFLRRLGSLAILQKN